jgi:hypothetical protein
MEEKSEQLDLNTMIRRRRRRRSSSGSSLFIEQNRKEKID